VNITHIPIREQLGPSMHAFLSTCWDENRAFLLTVLLSSGLAALLTVAIAVRHACLIHSAPISLLRMQYMRILWFAPVLGVSSFISLLCPRAYSLCKLLQLQSEALTLFFFGVILFILLAEESFMLCSAEARAAGDGVGATILRALRAGGKKKHFGVPPFGCCFRPLMSPHHMAPQHLMLARCFFQQYAAVVVVGSIFSAWCVLALDPGTWKVEVKAVGYVQKVSGFLAIYGLMILYVATHDLLEHWKTTSKFVAIKVVVLLCTFQEMVMSKIMEHVRPAQCIAEIHEGLPEALIDVHRDHFWNMYMTSLEAVLVAFLVLRAFPAGEIRSLDHEHQLLLVHMDLERLSKTASRCEDSGDSEEEEGLSGDGTDEDKDEAQGQV